MFTKTVSLEAPRNGSLWVLQLLGAILFFILGIAQLSSDQHMVQTFDAMGPAQWFRHAIGLIEVTSAIMLLVPALSGIAAFLLVLTTMGAILTHLFVGGRPALAIGLLMVVSVVAWGRKETTLKLFSITPWRRRTARIAHASRERLNGGGVWIKRYMKRQAEKLP